MIPWFKVFTRQRGMIERASDAGAGRAFKAMIEYAATGAEPEIEGTEETLLFEAARPAIEASMAEYAGKVKGSRKGGEANAKRIREMKSHTEPMDSHTEPMDRLTEGSIAEDRRQKKEERRKEDLSLSDGGGPTLEEVKEYASEMGAVLDPAEYHAKMVRQGWKDGNGDPVKNWKKHFDAFDRVERQRPPKPPKRNARPAEQHAYNFDEIETMMFAKQREDLENERGKEDQ